jgi:hypothetical protein
MNLLIIFLFISYYFKYVLGQYEGEIRLYNSKL